MVGWFVDPTGRRWRLELGGHWQNGARELLYGWKALRMSAPQFPLIWILHTLLCPPFSQRSSNWVVLDAQVWLLSS